MNSDLLALVVCILCGAFVHMGLKLISHFNHNKLVAIVGNYFVCSALGMTLSGINPIQSFTQTWYLAGFFIGLLFMIIFWTMAYNAQINGVSINALSNKLSVIIPVLFGIVFWHEAIHWYGILGISFAVISIVILSRNLSEGASMKNKILPLLVFLGSGFVDLSLKYMTKLFGSEASMDQISYSIFSGAFFFGTLLIIYLVLRRKIVFQWKGFMAGAMLGFPNYFSISLFLVAIQAFDLSSAFVFGSQKTGIVVISAFLAWLVFKEKWNKQKLTGLAFAIAAVILIANEQF